MKTTIAVIVTHNNYYSLMECINVVRNQTVKPDEILVVNNESSDYTSVWLDQQNDIHHIYQNNLGSAGGYFTGIDFAYTNGYDNVWCMNDDSYPATDALAMMLQEINDEPVLLQSNLVNKKNKQSLLFQKKKSTKTTEYSQGYIYGSNKSLNGTLINRTIINMVGLPKAKLFAKGDAAEYVSRIVKKFSIQSKIILSSKHYQSEADSYKQEWNLTKNWGYYFYIRNQREVLSNEYQYSFLQFVAYLSFILTAMYHIVRYQKNDKRIKANVLFKAVCHAFLNNYSYTPMCIKQFINRQYMHTPLRNFVRSIQEFFLSIFVPSHSLVIQQ